MLLSCYCGDVTKRHAGCSFERTIKRSNIFVSRLFYSCQGGMCFLTTHLLREFNRRFWTSVTQFPLSAPSWKRPLWLSPQNRPHVGQVASTVLETSTSISISRLGVWLPSRSPTASINSLISVTLNTFRFRTSTCAQFFLFRFQGCVFRVRLVDVPSTRSGNLHSERYGSPGRLTTSRFVQLVSAQNCNHMTLLPTFPTYYGCERLSAVTTPSL